MRSKNNHLLSPELLITCFRLLTTIFALSVPFIILLYCAGQRRRFVQVAKQRHIQARIDRLSEQLVQLQAAFEESLDSEGDDLGFTRVEVRVEPAPRGPK